MKRVLAAVLLAMLLFVQVGIGEGIDFSNYDDNGIAKLYDEINEEMVKRGALKSGVLPGGSYVIGVDIAEGMYEIYAEGYYLCTYFVFQSKDMYERYTELAKDMGDSLSLSWDMAKDDEAKRIDLKDGQVLFANHEVKLVEVKNSLMP